MDTEFVEPLAVETFAEAEDELHTAVTAAISAFLDTVTEQALQDALTAAGDPYGGAWRRALASRVVPVVERLWSSSYGRLATVTDTAREAANAFADAVADRTAAFPDRVISRARAVARRARDAGADRETARARVRDTLRTEQEWQGQARVISRTEAAAALNAGTLAAAFHQQDTTGRRYVKTWVARDDAKVRPAHAQADGQVQPLDGAFTVGDATLLFPGDPQGQPGQTFNCRCTLRIRPLDESSFAPQPGAPMTSPNPAKRLRFTYTFPDHITASADNDLTVTVTQDGTWRGPIGMTGEWSADDRMLIAPRDKQIPTRPLPVPLLVQWKLGGGHDGAEMGYARVDRIWLDGNNVMGQGQLDLDDPEGTRLARKIREGYIRFVSLDVDAATERQVCVDEDGQILPDCNPYSDEAPRVGRVYDTWRAMGATIVPHPAFPNAVISMADPATDPEPPGEVPVRRPVEMTEEGTEEPVADGGLKAAGLVLKAADTGRVLMLQRALDEEDPASGMWEWPGGGIEPQDPNPQAAAVREWEEETGQRLPSDAEFVGEWDSEDGVYRGHVAVVPAEGDVVANVDRENRDVVNPDDPDGDQIETLAWWDLELIPDMPALRAEVREQTPWAVLREAGAEVASGTRTELAADEGQEGDASAAGGCVAPMPDGSWRAAACDEEGAVPANEAGDGPAQEVEEAVVDATDEEVAQQNEEGADPEAHDDPADPDGPADEPADPEPGEADPVADAEEASEEPPKVPIGEEGVRAEPRAEGEPARDMGYGCVKPVQETGGYDPCDCNDPDAVTADATGGPVRYSTEPLENATRRAAAHMRERRTPADAAFMSLAASAFAHPEFRPPTGWFRDPKLPKPTLATVTEDGRIYGHLALWNVPHVAYQGRRVFAPHSPTKYDRFHARPIYTSEGLVEVGVLAMGTDHARPHASAGQAVSHYDSTGSIIGAIRCGEDRHGIWMAGALLPDIPADQRLRLSLAAFSGDWRDEGRGLDLKAALAVPAGHEGFYTPKVPASPEQQQDYALVASGAVTTEHIAELYLLDERITTAVDKAVHAALAARDRSVELAQRAQAVASQITRFRARAAARRVQRVQNKGLTSPTSLSAVLSRDFPGVKLGTKVDTELAKNWVDEQGGLPGYVDRISKHLQAKGFEEGHAIATAVNVVDKMCAEGDTNFPGAQRVGAESQAKACAAVEQWRAMKARANGDGQ